MHRTRYLARIPEMCGNFSVGTPILLLGDLTLPQAASQAVSEGGRARLQADCVHNVQPLRGRTVHLHVWPHAPSDIVRYTLSVSKDTNCVASRGFVFLGYSVAPDRLTRGENWTFPSLRYVSGLCMLDVSIMI